jgi:hypothetical protein
METSIRNVLAQVDPETGYIDARTNVLTCRDHRTNVAHRKTDRLADELRRVKRQLGRNRQACPVTGYPKQHDQQSTDRLKP